MLHISNAMSFATLFFNSAVTSKKDRLPEVNITQRVKQKPVMECRPESKRYSRVRWDTKGCSVIFCLSGAVCYLSYCSFACCSRRSLSRVL